MRIEDRKSSSSVQMTWLLLLKDKNKEGKNVVSNELHLLQPHIH